MGFSTKATTDGLHRSRMTYLQFEFDVLPACEAAHSSVEMRTILNAASKVCRLYREAQRFNKSVARDAIATKHYLSGIGIKFHF